MDKILFRRLAGYCSDDWLLIEPNLAGEWVMANKKEAGFSALAE